MSEEFGDNSVEINEIHEIKRATLDHLLMSTGTKNCLINL
jgi:hypothetical protein